MRLANRVAARQSISAGKRHRLELTQCAARTGLHGRIIDHVDLIDGAELRLVPDAGHLAPLTDPHIVDPMVAAHLVAADRALGNSAAAIAA